MRWQTKAALMQVLSGLPLGQDLHYIAQRRITRSLPSSDTKFIEIFDQAKKHIDGLRRHSVTQLEDAHLYEFGAGFELGIPLSFYALGAGSQILVDIRKLLRIELVNESIKKLQRMSLRANLSRTPERCLEGKHSDGHSDGHSDQWINLLEAWYGIRYLSPCDARNTRLETGSVDFVSSTNTLEHIPAPDIRLILKECRRLLKKDGVMSFIIDYKDHYSYSDPKITPYNFLQYSDSAWRWYSPAFHYQNRLRHKDHIRLIREAGFEVVEENLSSPSEADLAHLHKANISPLFKQQYSVAELAIRDAHLVVRA
jgi:SAM-dependent methyltransferase